VTLCRSLAKEKVYERFKGFRQSDCSKFTGLETRERDELFGGGTGGENRGSSHPDEKKIQES